MAGLTTLSQIKKMNIPLSIQVVTVVACDAFIIYQQVYVNNDYAAKADLERQKTIHRDNLFEGYTISLKRF